MKGTKFEADEHGDDPHIGHMNVLLDQMESQIVDRENVTSSGLTPATSEPTDCEQATIHSDQRSTFEDMGLGVNSSNI